MVVPNDIGKSVLTDNIDKERQRAAKLREYMRQKRLVEPGRYNNIRKIQRQNESLKEKQAQREKERLQRKAKKENESQ